MSAPDAADAPKTDGIICISIHIRFGLNFCSSVVAGLTSQHTHTRCCRNKITLSHAPSRWCVRWNFYHNDLDSALCWPRVIGQHQFSVVSRGGENFITQVWRSALQSTLLAKDQEQTTFTPPVPAHLVRTNVLFWPAKTSIDAPYCILGLFI